jgi:signal transduction histidine kinase
MYLPYYYVPGDMYWLMRVYFIVVVFYILYDLIRVYITSTAVEKTRVKYIFIGLAYGYSLGASALFLVYNINVDPMYSMLFGLYTIPFVYCFLKYDLLDVKVIAKRALGYAAAIICVGLVIVFLDVIGDFLHTEVPDMPYWFIPAISSSIVVGIGGLVWIKIREVDKLKYEFVTVVTHKFRTPLTYIAWSIDALKKNTSPEDREDALQSIKTASSRLAELTDLLIGLEKSEDSSYDYIFTHENLQKVVTECVDTEQARIKEKNIVLTKQFPDQDIIVNVDKRRLEFAIQIFIENAISYTPRDGAITLVVSKTRHHAVVKVVDTGIGIPKDEIQYLFTKFFRGKHARLVDTEGMGIGLFIARQIIAQQGGTVEVFSAGDGMGTTFTVKLPL